MFRAFCDHIGFLKGHTSLRVKSMEMFYKLNQQVLFMTGPNFQIRQFNEMFQQIDEDMLFLKGPSFEK